MGKTPTGSGSGQHTSSQVLEVSLLSFQPQLKFKGSKDIPMEAGSYINAWTKGETIDLFDTLVVYQVIIIRSIIVCGLSLS